MRLLLGKPAQTCRSCGHPPGTRAALHWQLYFPQKRFPATHLKHGGGDPILATVAVVERRRHLRRGPVWPGQAAAMSPPPLRPQASSPKQGACSAHGSLHGLPVGWGLWLGAFNLFPKPRLPRAGSPLAAMLFWPDRAFLPTGQDGRPPNSYPRSGIPWSPLDYVTSAPLWCWGTGVGQLLVPLSQIKTFPSHFRGSSP